jgi:phosphate transport system protein
MWTGWVPWRCAWPRSRAGVIPSTPCPKKSPADFAEMGRVAVELGNSAREVLLSQDPQQAARIDEEEDAMDELHRHLFGVLVDREWKHGWPRP